MKTIPAVRLFLAVPLVAGLVACSSSRYQPEPVANTVVQPASGGTAASAATPQTPAGSVLVPGVVEWGRAWYGPAKSKGTGQVTLTSDVLEWKNFEDSDRSFALRAGVVQRAWLTCASRPGQNLCLDLGIETLTGLEYHFRDVNWAGGDNASVMKIFGFLKEKFPAIQFEEKVVSKVD